MSGSTRGATNPPGVLRLIGIAGAYFITGKLGLLFAALNSSATAVWPPTGVALAAMLYYGYRVWPAIFAGAFFVNLTSPVNAAIAVQPASRPTWIGSSL